MVARVPIVQCAGIVVYLLAVTGISLLGTRLSMVVAKQAFVVASPYLDNGPLKLSLIERRRRDAAQAAQPLPDGARRRVIALQAPSTAPGILAARLDLAEKEDLAEPTPPTRVASVAAELLDPASHPISISALTNGSAHRSKFPTVRSASRYAGVSVRDEFNRAFGVLSVAAN